MSESLPAKTLVLGHPDYLIAEGLSSLLHKSGFDVVGKTSVLSILLDLAKQQPDIILVEPALSDDCVETIRTLGQLAPGATIAIITKKGAFSALGSAVEAGASGCISVDISSEEFIKSLDLISTGGFVVSKNMAERMRQEIVSDQKPTSVDVLSEREREVIHHIRNGATNRQIARQLFISEHTVKVHVRSILNKLNLKNRQQIAVYATEESLAANHDSLKSQ